MFRYNVYLSPLLLITVPDEVSMMDRRALEAADRTFQWLRGSEKPFGGITMVFSGDWRQILTVVPHGSRTEIVGRCLKSSYMWRDVKLLRLTENMRTRQATGGQDEADFATFLLNLGEEKIPVFSFQPLSPLLLLSSYLKNCRLGITR